MDKYRFEPMARRTPPSAIPFQRTPSSPTSWRTNTGCVNTNQHSHIITSKAQSQRKTSNLTLNLSYSKQIHLKSHYSFSLSFKGFAHQMNTFFLITTCILFVLSVPALAALKMRVHQSIFTYTSFSLMCIWQAVITAGTLWLTSLFGPLNLATLLGTLFFLIGQTLFKLMRIYAKG